MELKGKTVLFLGSSVTYGSAAGGVSFADIMAEKDGFDLIKEAVSGTTLVDIGEKSYVSRLKRLDKSLKPALAICQLSTNDATRKLPMPEIEDAVREIVDYTKKTFSCPVAFYTNPYYENAAYAEMVGMLNGLARELDVFVLDLYNDAQVTATLREKSDVYMKDAIHPTLLGYREWWTPIFEEFVHGI